jgi:superfamily II DNA or RNA helicase
MPLTLLNGNDGTLTYDEFLKEKVAFDKAWGFDPDAGLLASCLKPHQRAIIDWAVKGGRRAIFAAFGLGKSVMQLSVIKQVLAKHGGSGLIVAPLGVRSEFIHDGRNLLDGLEVRFIRRTEELDDEWEGIYVTNYESVRDGRLNVSTFTAVSLDEAAVLASYGSKTTQELLDAFSEIPYRFVATATPSPNEYLELINYAAFLGVMDRGAALTRFFQRDSKHAGNLTLYPHKREEFWLWLNTWACFVQRPSDLGFSDEGYDLQPLEVVWHEVETEIAGTHVERDGQGRLFRGGAMSSVEASKEKRDTIAERVEMVMRLVDGHVGTYADREAGRTPEDAQIVIWCDLNDEQTAIEQALAAEGYTFSSIHGGLSDDVAEARLDAWRDHKTFALVGKPVMLGQGMNLQQANVAIFAGVTYKFRQTIQAVHRIHRFGQERPCTVHLILAETETEVRNTLERKWAEHEELTERMSDLIREHGLSSLSISKALTRQMGVERDVVTGDAFTLALNDCVVEARDHMADCSVDMILTSIPFGNHYEYSLNFADFGHTDDNDHFWHQMDYATPEFLRVLKPGRIMAVHVKDRIRYGKVTGRGLPTSDPFHAEAIAHYTGHGFDFLGMITITTDVVRENNQTYRLGYTKMLRDSSLMGVGSPEYLLLFHKPQTDRSKGWADDRIEHTREDYSLARWQLDADAKWRSSGDRLLTVAEMLALDPATRDRVFKDQYKSKVYDFAGHLELAESLLAKDALSSEYASMSIPVDSEWIWDDVDRLATLNGEQSRRNLEFHICPLQFDIVDRAIERWTQPGELVFDPFSGLGTVPLRARRLGRRGYGAELNPQSHRDAVMYQREEDRKASIPSLFDLIDVEADGAA